MRYSIAICLGVDQVIAAGRDYAQALSVVEDVDPAYTISPAMSLSSCLAAEKAEPGASVMLEDCDGRGSMMQMWIPKSDGTLRMAAAFSL